MLTVTCCTSDRTHKGLHGTSKPDRNKAAGERDANDSAPVPHPAIADDACHLIGGHDAECGRLSGATASFLLPTVSRSQNAGDTPSETRFGSGLGCLPVKLPPLIRSTLKSDAIISAMTIRSSLFMIAVWMMRNRLGLVIFGYHGELSSCPGRLLPLAESSIHPNDMLTRIEAVHAEAARTQPR